MTLKEDHTHSGKTLERFRTLIQTGGDEGSPRIQKRSLAQLGMHPGSNICAADNAGCVNSTYGFFLAKKKKKPGTSLAVQWLRLHAPNAGTWVRSLVRQIDPTCCN